MSNSNFSSTFIVTALLLAPAMVRPQNLVTIPYGTAPVIDGIVTPGEWNDAGNIAISIMGGSDEVTVHFKHDCAQLHLLYTGPLESSSARFPELLLDMNHGQDTAWQADDWWFHVSATDCEYQGAYGDYSNCDTVRPHWKAEQNMTMGPPLTDTIEIRIPFGTIGLDLDSTDTVGLSFLVTNAFSIWEHWPAVADRNAPSTWGDAVFEHCAPLDVHTPEARPTIAVYPNPTNTAVHFSQPTGARLYDRTGRLLLETTHARGMDLSGIPAGVYFLGFTDRSGEVVQMEKVVRF